MKTHLPSRQVRQAGAYRNLLAKYNNLLTKYNALQDNYYKIKQEQIAKNINSSIQQSVKGYQDLMMEKVFGAAASTSDGKSAEIILSQRIKIEALEKTIKEAESDIRVLRMKLDEERIDRIVAQEQKNIIFAKLQQAKAVPS